MTKRKRKTKLLTGCPRCGGSWSKLSGFHRCASCGHVHEQRTMPERFPPHGHVQALIEDEEPKAIGTPKGKLSNSLRFD